jgi:predicted site-specific integrase-resolvase
MARIGSVIGSGRRDDYATVREVADEIRISPATLKRWLKNNKIPNVRWGEDSRGWYLVEKKSIATLRDYINTVHIVGR